MLTCGRAILAARANAVAAGGTRASERLDIIPPLLWGRAEGVRTVLRSLGEAAAPTAFGFVSQYVFGGPGSAAAMAEDGDQHRS